MAVRAVNPSTQEGRWIALTYARLSSAVKMPQDPASPVPQKVGGYTAMC